jgi:flagellar biosynthesis protein
MKKAIALKYSADLPAPFIVAKGQGELAQRMLEIADEYGIVIKSDAVLLDGLYVYDPGTCIPPEYYGIVARIFAFLAQIRERR